jgi:hypothetical protein
LTSEIKSETPLADRWPLNIQSLFGLNELLFVD